MAILKNKNFLLKNGKQLIIRSAEVIDADNFLKLGCSIISEEIYSLTHISEFNITIEQEMDWIKSNIENPNHLILVAELDNQIIGQLNFCNGLKRRIAHAGEFGMGVHKDFRGLGIGGLLLKTLIDWCKSHPLIEKINLNVHNNNNRAIALYEKQGFLKEGIRVKDLKYSNNEYIDTLIMGLIL